MKKNCRKIMALLTAVLLLAVGFTMTASADVKTGMTSARDQVLDIVEFVVTDIIAVGFAVICGAVFIYNLGMIFVAHKNGNDYQSRVNPAVLSGIGTALFASFAAWGPLLFQ